MSNLEMQRGFAAIKIGFTFRSKEQREGPGSIRSRGKGGESRKDIRDRKDRDIVEGHEVSANKTTTEATDKSGRTGRSNRRDISTELSSAMIKAKTKGGV
jgi:hypothetical protein